MSAIRNIDYENLKGLNAPFREAYENSFADLLDSGWFILGKQTEAFETAFAAYLGVPYFLGVASGLDALEMPLKVMGFSEGSEVIVPSNTYIATINAIINSGLKPVFVEPEPASYNINPEKIAEKINAKTVALMLVHLYGKPCAMDKVMPLVEKHKLLLIEDCAQSHGATFQGKMTGTFGIGAFSFYPTKNLGALGDAGGIAIQDEATYLKLKAWRNYGSRIKYQNDYIGANSRLDEIQAGFLTAKLVHLDAINAHKRHLAAIYDASLPETVVKPCRISGALDVYHIYPIRHPKRDALRAFLVANGIKTEIHYPIAPVDQQSIRDFFAKKNWDLPIDDSVLAREIAATELSLPISTIHTEEDIRYVCDQIKLFDAHD